ncbi:MAG: hypothetical protein EAZ55_10560 [Cytophagales bacterium]|nr:MAG: hypothetical protein EAZ55_10560 [Cytophagales bacterium]
MNPRTVADYQTYKPIGIANYGSIPHLPSSRMGKGKHHLERGQARIATRTPRDYRDLVIVQEKLDGANVGVVKLQGKLVCLSRSGHDCSISPYPLHRLFVRFVKKNEARFQVLLEEGERVCGEWLLVAHGTRYALPHEPLVVFDIFNPQNERLTYHDFILRVLPLGFVVPRLLHIGQPLPIEKALQLLDKDTSRHGALESIEGAIWRVERNEKVDFLCKYVKHGKKDGIYLDDNHLIFNQIPEHLQYLTQPILPEECL